MKKCSEKTIQQAVEELYPGYQVVTRKEYGMFGHLAVIFDDQGKVFTTAKCNVDLLDKITGKNSPENFNKPSLFTKENLVALKDNQTLKSAQDKALAKLYDSLNDLQELFKDIPIHVSRCKEGFVIKASAKKLIRK